MPRILVIDDQTQVRDLLKVVLNREGYEVFVAPNGREGLKAFYEAQPDLIITDLIMPDKEGLELITEIRGHSVEPKIIAISGGGRIHPEDYLALAEKLGAQRTFSKPFEQHEIIQAVKDLIGPGINRI